MKTSHKILLGCGGCLVLIIAAIAFLVGGFVWTGHRHQEGVQKFADEFMPLVASGDYDFIESFFAPEVREAVNREEQRRIFEWFVQLGELRSFENPKLVNIQASTKIPYSKILLYRFVAHYSNGDAIVDLALVQEGNGKYLVWGININSDALLPQQPEERPSVENQTATEA